MPNDSLHVAITVDPEIPVPPRHYGGIERIVDLLIGGLLERGHAVTLFAHKDSRVSCGFVPYAAARSGHLLDIVRNSGQIARRMWSAEFDLVHSFGRLAYLLPIMTRRIPKLMSYQRHVSRRSVALGTRLSRGSLQFSACSRSLLPPVADVGIWHVVHNAVPHERYVFRPHVPPDAPLVFLGRIEPIKGTHLAIEVARRAGRRLVVAGTVGNGPETRGYFEQQVAPYLDGKDITYIGPVDDQQKSDLLGRAAALLMPVLWDEPFGIVMPEALACGTPVIALRRGAVPEVVDHGVTGFVCDSVAHMVSAVAHVSDIDRGACSRAAEHRFSRAPMTDSYLAVYRHVVASSIH